MFVEIVKEEREEKKKLQSEDKPGCSEECSGIIFVKMDSTI